MIAFIKIVKLKMIDLLNRPIMLLLFLILPLLLGSIAGVANLKNQDKDIYIALVDEDHTKSSAAVIANLEAYGWHIYLSEEDQAQMRLFKNEVDALVIFRADFEADLGESSSAKIDYYEAEESMVSQMVREVLVSAVLPLLTSRSMQKELEEIYGLFELTMPPELPQRFERRLEEIRRTQAEIEIERHGNLVLTPSLTTIVSDYSMEVLFLSIYAILGTLSLSRANLRQRLGSTSYGLIKDYTATLISLQIFGEVQILLYTASMFFFMHQPIGPYDLLVLSVFLYLILSIGQLLALISDSIRLFLSLMLLLFSAGIGGCFFQLSSRILLLYGQYSPHGWALAKLRGTKVLPIWMVMPVGFVFLILGYFLQRRKVAQTTD